MLFNKFLKKYNGVLIEKHYWVVGSQEIQTFVFNINNENLKIEIETFEGVTACASKRLINLIKNEFEKIVSSNVS